MNRVTNFAMVGILTSTCAAVPTVLRYTRDSNGQRVIEEVDAAAWSNRSGFSAYDNWRDPSLGGRTHFSIGSSEYPIGTAEIGDDLQLLPIGDGIVSDIGWTYLNASTTNIITHFQANIRFFNQSRQLVGSDVFVEDLRLQPQGGVLVFSGGAYYSNLHIPISQQMFMSIQFTDIVGANPGDMGMLVGGPITRGSSSQYIYNFTTGEQIDLGTAPQRNLGFFIDAIPTPAPGVLATLLAASPCVLRRRR